MSGQPGKHVGDATETGEASGPSPSLYAVVLLALTYTLNTADRSILNILVPPIKEEFGLTDWQIGVLAGPLFALIYAISSIPFASWSDRTNRRNLISVTMMVFGGATAACGLATTYLHLMIARFVTGSAESATVPAATSMIADIYPAHKRVWAIAIFSAGGSFGATFAGLVGGVIAHRYGWREAFFVMGVPGVLLAIALLLTVREPARAHSRTGQRVVIPLWQAIRQIFAQKSFRWLCTGNILLFFHNSGVMPFHSLFLVQVHGFNLEQVGFAVTAWGVAGLMVTLAVGKLTDRLAQARVEWFMYIPAIVALLGIPFAMALLLSPDRWFSLVVGSSGSLVVLAYAAPLYAAAQALVPNEIRARAIAILLLLTNLIGVGLGAPTAGILSDTLRGVLGDDEGLRWALLIMLIPNLLAAFAFWRASRTLAAEIEVVGADR